MKARVPDIQQREGLGTGQGRPESDQGSAESAFTELEVTTSRFVKPFRLATDYCYSPWLALRGLDG